jgi:hypothetical protein
MIWQNTKPPLGAKINWSHPLSKGIVGCWLFNEGMGDKVYDSSGNGNTGTLTNFSHPATVTSGWNPGKFGRAINFDGSNDRIQFVNNSTLNLSSSFSLCCWVCPLVLPTNGTIQSLICKYEGQNSYGMGGYDLRIINDGGIQKIGLVTNKPIASGGADFAYTMIVNKTYFIVGTFDCVKSYIYVNGVYVSSINNVVIPGATNKLLNFGNFGTYSGSELGRYFNGIISNIYFYNRVLLPSEVLQLYTEPFCMFNN